MAEEQPVTRRPRKWVDYDRKPTATRSTSSCAKPQDGATNSKAKKYPATGMQKPIPKFSDATPAVSQYLGEAVVVPIRRTMKGRGVIDRERAKFAEFADAFNRTGSALDAMLDMAERGQFLGICSVDDQAMAMMRDLIELFQRVYIGIALPKCAANRALWEKPSHKGPETKPYSEGGIIATVVGHNDDGATLVTQQGFHRATWSFLDTYCDEAYIGIPTDWPATDRHFYRARFVIDQARQKVAA